MLFFVIKYLKNKKLVTFSPLTAPSMSVENGTGTFLFLESEKALDAFLDYLNTDIYYRASNNVFVAELQDKKLEFFAVVQYSFRVKPEQPKLLTSGGIYNTSNSLM